MQMSGVLQFLWHYTDLIERRISVLAHTVGLSPCLTRNTNHSAYNKCSRGCYSSSDYRLKIHLSIAAEIVRASILRALHYG